MQVIGAQPDLRLKLTNAQINRDHVRLCLSALPACKRHAHNAGSNLQMSSWESGTCQERYPLACQQVVLYHAILCFDTFIHSIPMSLPLSASPSIQWAQDFFICFFASCCEAHWSIPRASATFKAQPKPTSGRVVPRSTLRNTLQRYIRKSEMT